MRRGAGQPGSLHVDDLRLRVLVEPVLAVCPADPGAPTGMEALHGLEVLAIDVGLAEAQLAQAAARSLRSLV